jgi:serine acetyltransferase
MSYLKHKVLGLLLPDDVALMLKYRGKYRNTPGRLARLYFNIRYERLIRRNSAFIPMDVELNGAVFPHGLSGIFISQGAVLGTGCTIFQQVTIGSNTLKDTKRGGAPRIGDGVYIGAGAKIIGGVAIGSNVRIGANCAVAQDIPDNCTVVQGAVRIIPHNELKSNNFNSWDGHA